MQVEVLPSFRLPRNKTTFTYAVPKEMEPSVFIGQIVAISWRNKSEQGVITQIHQENVYTGQTKPIKQVLEPTPSFSLDQLGALYAIAKRYHIAPATALSLFLPSVPKKEHKRKEAVVKAFPKLHLNIHKSAVTEVEKILSGSKISSIKLSSEADRFFLYRQAIQKHSSVLIICSTYLEAEQLVSYLVTVKKDSVALWDNRVGKNDQWNLWNAIKQGKKTIIVSTRSGLFLPFPEKPILFLDQEGRSEHKQFEGSPYFDAREICKIYASTRELEYKKLAFLPSIEESQNALSSKTDSIPLQVFYKKSGGIFTPSLEENLKASTPQKRAVIVVSNLADATTLYCLDCERTWQCETCAIGYRIQGNQLVCSICSETKPMPSSCFNCKGINIKPLGVGLPSIKAILENDYKLSVGSCTGSESILQKENAVILCTPYQMKKVILEEQYAIASLHLFHPEQVLYTPDFRAGFQLYHLIQWHKLMAKQYTQKELSLQTNLNLDHPLLQQILEDSFQSFKEKELALRKSLKYPPYSDFVKISFEKDLDFSPESGNFMGPFLGKKHKKYWILKETETSLAGLDKMMGSFYNKAKIDLNPDQFSFIQYKE